MMLMVEERGLGKHAPRGENRGKTARHDEVARMHHDLGYIGLEATAIEILGEADLAMDSLWSTSFTAR